MRRIEKWWNGKSGIYAAYTRGEVVLVHLGVIVMLLACGFAEWLCK